MIDLYTNNTVTEYKYNVKYIDENGVLQSCPKATVVNNTMKGVWPAGWYVAVGTVTMESASVAAEGAVHLILADGCNLKVSAAGSKAGIRVSGSSNSLTIYGQSAGTGVLNANGHNTCAGIGGANFEDGENITINGGTVIAAGREGAGIGGGKNGAGKNITINGGRVTATGADGGSLYYGGAGIGGGDFGVGSDITIRGGTVTAASAAYGAGIGGGRLAKGHNIIISGGTVTATGGKEASGIGGGSEEGAGYNITINGGSVTAYGGSSGKYSGAGIGGGSFYDGTGTITGESIYASNEVVVKADNNNPPTTDPIIHKETDDIGEQLTGKRYGSTCLDYGHA